MAHTHTQKDKVVFDCKGSTCGKYDIHPDAFDNGGCTRERVENTRFCAYHLEQVRKAALRGK